MPDDANEVNGGLIETINQTNKQIVMLILHQEEVPLKSRAGIEHSQGLMYATTLDGREVEYVDENTFCDPLNEDLLVRTAPLQKNP
jgi:hypothetical protein